MERHERAGSIEPAGVMAMAWYVQRKAIQESASLFAAFSNASAIGLALCDKQLRYRAINSALAAMNGIPAKAHLGNSSVTFSAMSPRKWNLPSAECSSLVKLCFSTILGRRCRQELNPAIGFGTISPIRLVDGDFPSHQCRAGAPRRTFAPRKSGHRPSRRISKGWRVGASIDGFFHD
jgi:PAS domain-containing protein